MNDAKATRDLMKYILDGWKSALVFGWGNMNSHTHVLKFKTSVNTALLMTNLLLAPTPRRDCWMAVSPNRCPLCSGMKGPSPGQGPWHNDNRQQTANNQQPPTNQQMISDQRPTTDNHHPPPTTTHHPPSPTTTTTTSWTTAFQVWSCLRFAFHTLTTSHSPTPRRTIIICVFGVCWFHFPRGILAPANAKIGWFHLRTQHAEIAALNRWVCPSGTWMLQ